MPSRRGSFLAEPPQERTKETRLSLDLPAGLSPIQESDPNKLLPNQVAEAAPWFEKAAAFVWSASRTDEVWLARPRLRLPSCWKASAEMKALLPFHCLPLIQSPTRRPTLALIIGA